MENVITLKIKWLIWAEMKSMRKNQMQMLEMKNLLSKMKNAFDRYTSRLDKSEKEISEFEDRLIKIIQVETWREKWGEKYNNASKNCVTISSHLPCIIGIPEVGKE